MKNILYIILISFITSQTVSDYAYFGADASALAGAVVASPGGSWSMAHNPAGITEVENLQFSFGSGNLFGFSWLPAYHMNAIIKLPVLGNAGIAFYQINTSYQDVELSSEQTLSIANGYTLQEDNNSHLSIGFTVNLVQWELGNSAGVSGDGTDGLALGSLRSFTFDLGVQSSLREKYRFGAAMKNINSATIGEGTSAQVLPRRLDFGITYLPLSDLNTSIALQRILGNNQIQIKGGIEYDLNASLKLRLGIQANPNRLGAGFSLDLLGFMLDYGMLTHPVLPITHQLQLRFSP